MKSIEILPVNFDLHSDICIHFRIDSFICSFGSDEAFWGEDGQGDKRYLRWLRSKNPERYRAFHVWKADKIIGQLELGESRPGDDFGYINLFYLIPEERGRGVSFDLSKFCDDYLKSLGFNRAKLSVSPLNFRAVRFYEKHGWKDLGPRLFPGRTGLALNLHFMEKNLD